MSVFSIYSVSASSFATSCHATNSAVVADIAQGLPIAILDGHRSALEVASFGPHGQLVSASTGGTSRLWDARSPYHRWSSESMNDACGIAIGAQPDGRFVAVGCNTWVLAGGDRADIARGNAVELYALPGRSPAATHRAPSVPTCLRQPAWS